MNNIKDDRALTETPARYPLLKAWPSSQPDSGSQLEGFQGKGERRGAVWRDVWGRSGGAAPGRGSGGLQPGVQPPGPDQAGHLPSPGLSLPF